LLQNRVTVSFLLLFLLFIPSNNLVTLDELTLMTAGPRSVPALNFGSAMTTDGRVFTRTTADFDGPENAADGKRGLRRQVGCSNAMGCATPRTLEIASLLPANATDMTRVRAGLIEG
jgi:hypothetical protein